MRNEAGFTPSVLSSEPRLHQLSEQVFHSQGSFSSGFLWLVDILDTLTLWEEPGDVART